MLRVMPLLIVLIGLCSCATKHQTQPVVVAQTLECPAPVRPELPEIDGAQPFDGPDNMETLMTRDDILRQYIRALTDCIECYRRQVH